MSRDVNQEVTDRILAALDEGTVPWRRPWRDMGGHKNLQSGRSYRGINQLLLSMSGFESPYWTTYRAAKKAGGNVRKGEKGTLVTFWKMLRSSSTDSETGEKSTRTFPMLRHYTVFNTDQCDGLEIPEAEDIVPVDPIESGETVIAGYPDPPSIAHGGDSAHYVPATDSVQLPIRDAFESPRGYYYAAFHELAHSTGHEKRLNRPELAELAGFGSESYSQEELTAELGASFLCAESTIDPDVPQRAAYIASWRRVLGEDPKLIVRAAGRAQKAADLILDRELPPFED